MTDSRSPLETPEGFKPLFRSSPVLEWIGPLCGRGDVNTYSIFAELKRSLLNPAGRVESRCQNKTQGISIQIGFNFVFGKTRGNSGHPH